MSYKKEKQNTKCETSSWILSRSQIFRFTLNLVSSKPQTHRIDMLGRLILDCLLIWKKKTFNKRTKNHGNLAWKQVKIHILDSIWLDDVQHQANSSTFLVIKISRATSHSFTFRHRVLSWLCSRSKRYNISHCSTSLRLVLTVMVQYFCSFLKSWCRASHYSIFPVSC